MSVDEKKVLKTKKKKREQSDNGLYTGKDLNIEEFMDKLKNNNGSAP